MALLTFVWTLAVGKRRYSIEEYVIEEKPNRGINANF